MEFLDRKLLDVLENKAKQSPRRRAMYNYHKYMDDPLQRMVNFLLVDSYVQPHKHEKPDKREMFLVLEGKLLVVEFSEDGFPRQHQLLDPAQGRFGGEIQAGTWHTIIPVSSHVVVFEVKDGPYNPNEDKHFASWAPTEDDPACLMYNQKLIDQLVNRR